MLGTMIQNAFREDAERKKKKQTLRYKTVYFRPAAVQTEDVQRLLTSWATLPLSISTIVVRGTVYERNKRADLVARREAALIWKKTEPYPGGWL
jgi:hypothetical protein